MAEALARRGAAFVVVMTGALLLAPRAQAIEAFDGRIQLHGFGEQQMRVLNRSFSEEADLAQWYNVLNLELETDIAPNGFGPFDLLQSYSRFEVRYDCIYSHGCGMMESVNTYGDDAKRLPQRLRDAKDYDYGGVIETDERTSRIQDERPANWAPLQVIPNVLTGDSLFDNTWIKHPYNPNMPEAPNNRPFITIVRLRQGFPGFDTLFQTTGADGEIGVNADTGLNDDPANYTFGPQLVDYKWTFRDKKGPAGGTGETAVMGPWLPKNFIGTIGLLNDRANPFRGLNVPVQTSLRVIGAQTPRPATRRTTQLPLGPLGTPYPHASPTGDIPDPRILPLFLDPVTGWGVPGTGRFPSDFAGDYSGIIPCFAPAIDPGTPAQVQINGGFPAFGCVPGANVNITGGTAELPLRPAPDAANTAAFDVLTAQGLYVPSGNMRRALMEQDFDSHEFNFREAERAWNRGQSQQETKEVKEAYIDAEMLDSRLWMRLGLQNIVWGKTELFRTTDQFNPQDLALGSLVSLEESRIALFSGRFVYSLYDVGPLEDVRAEVAFNFDRYKPADLGACGEPFTPDIVCGLTTGLLFHGITGIGIAGIDRPPNPWESIKGLEIGGRVEWRWDRFSFALMDFWGYNDFPYPDAINYYERNVDPATGRPRIAGSRGSCATPAWFLGPGSVPFSAADPKQYEPMQGGMGVGVDPDCLKFGGAAGQLAENRWDPADYATLLAWIDNPVGPPPILYDLVGSSPQNALENHYANQQLFAWICSGTVTIAASVDPGACAWTIFGSRTQLSPGLIDTTLTEVLTTIFAGENDGKLHGSPSDTGFLVLIQSMTKDGAYTTPVPLQNINRDFMDGPITATNPYVNFGSPGVNFGGFQAADLLTMDSTLSNEQRALFGCGPFFGTRCDSALGFNFFTRVLFGPGGGFDPLNTEASALLQSFTGIEGTAVVGKNGYTDTTGTWTTTQRGLVQPATIGYFDLATNSTLGAFEGGPACTRPDGNGGLIILPGCRGAQSVTFNPNTLRWMATFDNGYNVAQDGCVFARTIQGLVVDGQHADGSPVNLTPCGPAANGGSSQTREGNYNSSAVLVSGARTLWHPLAGCKTAAQVNSANPADRNCTFVGRNFDLEFINGTSSIFRNEVAAVSWNMMQFLVITSCDYLKKDIQGDPECFNPDDSYRITGCSFAVPYKCANVKGFLGVAGPNRNTIKAGGNGTYGRRDFIWHSGGELALRYAKRNVFGISTDFAEDVTKTNWGMEFTYIGKTPYLDADDYVNSVTESSTVNLTVSIDRPTFINFLNPNRTFFFNTQWFFQYLTNYNDGFSANGPFNVLFTLAAFTGYYQDRLLPTMITVFDFNSRSGGILPSVAYRFTENFSMTTGFNLFFGKAQYKDMPGLAFAPTSNRAGKNAYKDGVENVLSAIDRRDEVFLRLRYTF